MLDHLARSYVWSSRPTTTIIAQLAILWSAPQRCVWRNCHLMISVGNSLASIPLQSSHRQTEHLNRHCEWRSSSPSNTESRSRLARSPSSNLAYFLWRLPHLMISVGNSLASIPQNSHRQTEHLNRNSKWRSSSPSNTELTKIK
jgi:hypothetical protein